MNKLILTLSVVFAAGSVHAQTFKVIKSKGSRAVIQLPKGMTLEKGLSYSIAEGDRGSMPSEGEGGAVTGGGGGMGPRTKSLGGSGEIFFGSRKPETGESVSLMEIDLNGRYGWNGGTMEYGPIVGVRYAKQGTNSTSRTISAGGFFDWNLVPNATGTDLVYGAGAMATFGSTSTKTGNFSDSGSEITFGAGGQVKWFALGNSTAFRFDGQLQYVKASEMTTTGLYIAAGLQTYF